MLLVNPQSLEHIADPFDNPKVRRIPRELMDLLAGRDRLLIELATEQRLSRRQTATAMGLSPGTVTRRLRRLFRRLHLPIVRALVSPAAINLLTRQQRQVGIEYFVQASTISALARRHGMTPDQVRSILQYIRGWHVGRENR